MLKEEAPDGRLLRVAQQPIARRRNGLGLILLGNLLEHAHTQCLGKVGHLGHPLAEGEAGHELLGRLQVALRQAVIHVEEGVGEVAIAREKGEDSVAQTVAVDPVARVVNLREGAVLLERLAIDLVERARGLRQRIGQEIELQLLGLRRHVLKMIRARNLSRRQQRRQALLRRKHLRVLLIDLAERGQHRVAVARLQVPHPPGRPKGRIAHRPVLRLEVRCLAR